MSALHEPRPTPEHPSLDAYLTEVLGRPGQHRVGIVSFNHWDFVVGAIAEIALGLRAVGATPVLALWADETPMRDIAWTTSRPLSRILRSPGRDDRLREGLTRSGIARPSFVAPPIRRWKPIGPMPDLSRRYRTAMREVRYRDARVGRAILQSIPDTDTPLTDDYLWPPAWLKATSTSFAWAYDQTRELIEREGLTALIAYNGRFLHDAAASAAAEHAGIPVLSYDMGGNDTDFDLTIDATHDWSALQRRMLRMYDAWDPRERDLIGGSWFLERSEHADARNSRFVESQRVGEGIERPEGLLIAYFSSSGDEISELDLDWSEYFGDQAGALIAVGEACRDIGATFLVRSHPHKRRKPRRDVEEWHEAVAAARPDIHLDEHSPVDSYTLMRQADAIVTYGSTTGVEAAFAGRPVIVMGPSAYDELGCATRVRTSAELQEAIRARVPGERRGALAYGLMMRRRGFAYERVARDARTGERSVCGVTLGEPSHLVLAASDILIKRERSRLSRGAEWATIR